MSRRGELSHMVCAFRAAPLDTPCLLFRSCSLLRARAGPREFHPGPILGPGTPKALNLMATQRSMRLRPLTSRGPFVLVGLLVGVFASCDYDPGHADLSFGLSETTMASLDDVGLASSSPQVSGALTTLFGTPQDPHYLITGDMLDGDENPNLAGDFELSEEQWETIARDNRSRRFLRQLDLIASERFAEVPEPLYAGDLWAIWTRDFAPLHTGEASEDGGPATTVDPASAFPVDDLWVPGLPEDGATWAEAARLLFVQWYPSMRESAEMYRAQCLHCHGVDGGGNGPTGEFLEPRPRDYRLGKFKWIAVENGKRPRRQDLVNILMQGAYTTAMPNFARFSSGQLHGLVDYVRLLAMRGETESRLVLEMGDSDSGDLPLDTIQSTYSDVWANWRDADENYVAADVVVPRWDQMSVEDQVTRGEHGRELFMGTLANCFSCHGMDGRGADAPNLPISLAEVVDADDHEIDPEYEARGGYRWVELKDANGQTLTDAEGHAKRDLYRIKPDDWGNPSMPRNFTRSIFRGGSRPIDLYRRIKYGITGSIMPAAEAGISDEDIWDLVIYVKTLANSTDLARVYEHKRAALAELHEAEHGDAGHSDDHDDDDDHTDTDTNDDDASGH